MAKIDIARSVVSPGRLGGKQEHVTFGCMALSPCDGARLCEEILSVLVTTLYAH